MRNPLTRPEGLWDRRPLEHWECEHLDRNQGAAINGDDGESFDAETQIVIGGDGMRVTAPFRAAQCTYAALVPAEAVVYGSRSLQRFQATDCAVPEIPSGWSIGDSFPIPYVWGQGDGTWTQLQVVNDYLWVPLHLPVGSTLTAVTMTISGGYRDPITYDEAAHAGAPSTMPRLDVMRAGPTAIAGTSIGGQTDTYVSDAAYKAPHLVTQSGMSEVVLAGRKYSVRIRGESGSNSLIRLRVHSIRATCTITSQDEWIT